VWEACLTSASQTGPRAMMMVTAQWAGSSRAKRYTD